VSRRGVRNLVLGALALAAALVITLVVALGGGGGGSPPPAGPPGGEPGPSSAGYRPEEQAALAAARRFLEGYLPYMYGHGSLEAIQAIAVPLREELGRMGPGRIRPEDRDLSGTVTDLRVVASRGDLGLDVRAFVRDARYAYTINLGVRSDAAGRWLVAGLG
jgi:hypothetical protein